MSTTRLTLPFGRTEFRVALPTSQLLGIFLPREMEIADEERTILQQALAHPSGTPPLRKVARPDQQVAIVTSDLTRPCPSARLLPPLLDELAAAGVPDERVTLIFALGLHRPMTSAEMGQATGAGLRPRLKVLNHDPTDTVYLGTTAAGTPVEIFRPLVESDLRVCLGNVEFHYFAGYSGGAKAVLPGCASRATVSANHALMTRPGAVAGQLEGNPVRTDLEEGATMLGVDFVLNVVVDPHHRIVAAAAGDVTTAHRQACEEVSRRGKAAIPAHADIVLASAGGFPKDLNLYQAQKGLDNAAHAVKEGGIIILVAECAEGFGNRTFESWLEEAHSPEEVLARIETEFVLGGHKAAAVATVLRQAQVFLVSALPPGITRACGLVPFADPETALAAALAAKGSQASLIALPQAASVLPEVGS